MLKYDRNDISEGIDVNKTIESKGCKFCHYWYGPYLCDSFYNIVQRSTDF